MKTKTPGIAPRPVKPRFKIGQVVALWADSHPTPSYYKIRSTYLDDQGQRRYTFERPIGEYMALTLCPVERRLRALQVQEFKGPKKSRVVSGA